MKIVSVSQLDKRLIFWQAAPATELQELGRRMQKKWPQLYAYLLRAREENPFSEEEKNLLLLLALVLFDGLGEQRRSPQLTAAFFQETEQINEMLLGELTTEPLQTQRERANELAELNGQSGAAIWLNRVLLGPGADPAVHPNHRIVLLLISWTVLDALQE